MEFRDGIYDQVLTEAAFAALADKVSDQSRSVAELTTDDSAARLADALATQLVRILDDLDGKGADKIRRQLDLVNSILVATRQRLGRTGHDIDAFHDPLQVLQAIHRTGSAPAYPDTGLANPWLFTCLLYTSPSPRD